MYKIINQNALPGTTIIIDQWRAYNKALLNMTEMNHQTINHSINFVEIDNWLIHT